MLSFFSYDNFLYHIIGLCNFKLSLLLLHQDISHISKTALLILKSLGKHLQLRSMTFKLRKWSPLVLLLRIHMPLGMGEQKFLAGFHDPKNWTFLAWGAFEPLQQLQLRPLVSTQIIQKMLFNVAMGRRQWEGRGKEEGREERRREMETGNTQTNEPTSKICRISWGNT